MTSCSATTAEGWDFRAWDKARPGVHNLSFITSRSHGYMVAVRDQNKGAMGTVSGGSIDDHDTFTADLVGYPIFSKRLLPVALIVMENRRCLFSTQLCRYCSI